MQQFKAKDGTLVDRERWGWVVEYKNGSYLFQFNEGTGEYNNFASINLPEVDSIYMQNIEGKQFYLKIPAGAKLIHYYDNIIQSKINGQSTSYRLYCFGYELGKEKKIFTILPTDVVIHGEVENVEVL